MRFTFEGREYAEAEKPMFAELSYCERMLGQDLEDWSATTRMFVSYFVAIRRKDPAILTWERMISETGPDDFEPIREAAPPVAGDPPVEVPEDQWPVDPTERAIQTDPRAESSPYCQPQVDPDSLTYGPSGYGTSPYDSGGPQPHSMP